MDKLMLCTQYYKYLHVPAHGLCEEAIAVGRVVTKIPPGVHKGAVTQSGLLQTCANLADLCGVVLHIKKILFGNMLMLLQPPSSHTLHGSTLARCHISHLRDLRVLPSL